MNPRSYSFVRNGPDCKWCHHARLDHVGWDERYEMQNYDLRCQVPGCEDCGPRGYRPLGPLSYLVLTMHDAVETEAAWAAEHARQRRLRRPIFVSLWGSVGLLVAASAANYVMESTALAVLLTLGSLGLLVAYTVLWLRITRNSDPPRRLLTAATLLPVPILVLSNVQVFVTVPPPWPLVSLVTLIGSALVLIGIEEWTSSRRHKRVLRRMQEDLGTFEHAGRRWQPLFVMSVRVDKPDTDEPQSPG